MPINKEPATPPMIGKIGPYTVFVTPPSIPNPSFDPPVQSSHPVFPPPVQYPKSGSAHGSNFGFFWDTVTKVQNAHSSLDDYVARWFGLNQSKYQWALDDYYEKRAWTRLMQKFKIYPPRHKVCKLFLGQVAGNNKLKRKHVKWVEHVESYSKSILDT